MDCYGHHSKAGPVDLNPKILSNPQLTSKHHSNFEGKMLAQDVGIEYAIFPRVILFLALVFPTQSFQSELNTTFFDRKFLCTRI
jgi:hypothetical protein